jgi:hypothetical protein
MVMPGTFKGLSSGLGYREGNMEKILATVRVTSEEGPAVRPSRERVHYVASILRRHGLEVFHEGRFGVSVRAKPEQLARTLSLGRVEGDSHVLQVDSSRVAPDLNGLIDLVEITSLPRFF